MQAAMETNGVRPAATPCQIGNDTGSGSVAASDPDSVQTGAMGVELQRRAIVVLRVGIVLRGAENEKGPV
jgi:hypothetical protein